jgi:outer membrane protein OmpA-like peptidoglycan-associated protein
VAAPVGSHAVDVNATGRVRPTGRPEQSVTLSSTTATLNVPAGTEGTIQLSGTGHYEINDGTLLEPFPHIGDFSWTTEWTYRCTPEGTLTVNATPRAHTQNQDPSGRDVFRQPIAIGWSANTDGSSEVSESLIFSRGAGSNPGVGVGPVSVNVPLSGNTANAFQVLPRLHLNVTGARAAAPAPAPSATATATASVTVPMPARVTVPPPHTIYFADEAQTTGDAGELTRWASGLPSDAQDAIRDGRLSVTAIGYASTTGTPERNFDVYSRERAEWVRGVLEPALGMARGSLHVGWRGSYTAPPADRSRPGGVANPRERRVDITFAETAPTTPSTVSTTATSRP